jgi:hypothetical protein
MVQALGLFAVIATTAMLVWFVILWPWVTPDGSGSRPVRPKAQD